MLFLMLAVWQVGARTSKLLGPQDTATDCVRLRFVISYYVQTDGT
jgi:hypothetical protein